MRSASSKYFYISNAIIGFPLSLSLFQMEVILLQKRKANSASLFITHFSLYDSVHTVVQVGDTHTLHWKIKLPLEENKL